MFSCRPLPCASFLWARLVVRLHKSVVRPNPPPTPPPFAKKIRAYMGVVLREETTARSMCLRPQRCTRVADHR